MGKYNIICAIQNEKGRENMRILCIGDSNTWGYNPENGRRFEKRWTTVLAS